MKSWVEVSVGRLRANVAAIQEVSGPNVQVLAVIKADAYGHGAQLVAPVLAGAGVRWLGVDDLDEGEQVRRALANAGFAHDAVQILVMCGMEPQDAAGIVAQGLTPVVWTTEHVQVLQAAAEAAGQRVSVHLEIDSGMARQGAKPGADLADVLDALRGASRVRCDGVFTHLSSSEVHGSPETAKQQARFAQALAEVYAAELLPQYLHVSNSSAVDEGTALGWLSTEVKASSQTVLVRPGLATYGYCLPIEAAEDGGALRARVQPVLQWKTRVIGMREIAAGDTVGYGATFVARVPMRLALLPVGYADGFRREASSGIGNGWVMIAGRRAAVVGRVSMNLMVVDVTEIAGVSVGTEAVLLGEGVSAEEHARWCGTIPYEILCGIRAEKKLTSA